MTLAPDQNTDPGCFPNAAARMLALREQVFAVWQERMRARIPQASKLRHPILLNTFPAFYDTIAQSISGDDPRSVAVDGSTRAAEHGGERARITSYDHGALIEEYQLLRAAIFEVLDAEHVRLGYREVHAINASIDIAIQESIQSFTLVHNGLRERFAAALTHDLRSPLSNCTNALELILMSDDPAHMRALAGRALGSARRVRGMVDELLDTMAFHGGQQLQLTIVPLDILDVLQDVEADAAELKGHELRWRKQSVRGWWDRTALKRAIENLVGNAAKYSRPGTPVTVTIDQMHGRLSVAVHNEGAPIPPDEQECIFQMYRRSNAAADGHKQGWGIGLPYVRAVAESHGGSIDLDSSHDRGTVFTINVPLDARPFIGAPTLALG